ncbi:MULTISPECIES: hypothetical protein [Nonomuraea]|uniref:LacI family transcriptional regulator n=1 Tax=Nonomuraea salmonea TaxID=46181 RepID=A0ABV5NVP5_9ACTN
MVGPKTGERVVGEVGTRAAEVLLDILDGGGEPARTTHTLRSRLIRRSSVAPPRVP